MKADGNIVVGLDIGTTKVVAMVGEKAENGKIRILGYGHAPSVGVHRGSVINIAKASEAIQQAVRKAEENTNVEIHSVYVGIAGQHIQSYRTRGMIIRPNPDAEITKREVKDLQNSMFSSQTNPGERIIHVMPQVFTLDRHQNLMESDIIGMVGTNIEASYHIVTAQEEAVNLIQRSVEKAGLELEGFVLEPMVSALSVLNEDEKQAGVVLVDIGGGTTDVAIFQGSVLWHTSVIAIAGKAITDDIVETCRVLPSQGECLKVQYGAALPDEESKDLYVSTSSVTGRKPREICVKNLIEIIKARMEEILAAVQLEIDASGCKNMLGGIVLTGGGAKLKHLQQLTDYIIGRESRIGLPTRYLSEDSPAELSDPIFATGIGLVMLGLEREAEKAEEEALQQAEMARAEAEAEAAALAAQAARKAEAAATVLPSPEAEEEAKGKPETKFGWPQKFKDMVINWVKAEADDL